MFGQASERTKKPSHYGYEIRKTIFGKVNVHYPCPRCGERLESPLSDAGTADSCPDCGTRFVVPGADAKQSISRNEQEAREKRTQQLATPPAAAPSPGVTSPPVMRRSSNQERHEVELSAHEQDRSHGDHHRDDNAGLSEYIPNFAPDDWDEELLENGRDLPASHRKLNDLVGEIESLETLNRLNAADGLDLNRLGIAYHKHRDLAKAIQCYRRSAAAKRGKAPWFNLALVYSDPEISQDADAADACRCALSVVPDDAPAKELLERTKRKLAPLATQAKAGAGGLVEPDEFFDFYISPFEMLQIEDFRFAAGPDAKAIKKAKDRLKSELDLNGGKVGWLGDYSLDSLDKARALAVVDELDDEAKWRYHVAIFRNKPLLNFLTRGDIQHFLYSDGYFPCDTEELLHREPGFRTFLSKPFARQYNRVLSRAIQQQRLAVVEVLFDGRRWVEPEDTDLCFEGASKRVGNIVEAMRSKARDGCSRKVGLREMQDFLRERSLPELFNLLPSHFARYQGDIVDEIRNLAISCFKQHGDPVLLKGVLSLCKRFTARSVALTKQLEEDFKTIEEMISEREDAQTTVGQSDDLTEAKGDNDDDDSGSRTKLSWSLVLWGAFLAYACFVFDPPTVLTVVSALMILVPLFLGSIAATSLLISFPIEELSIFYGQTLYEHRFSSFVLRINSIPLGGNVKLYPNVYERSHISKKLLLCLPGCLCLFVVAAICLGAEASMYSIVEGIRQIATGAISPLGTGRRLVGAAHEYLRTEPFGVALGMVAAKQCATELLPLSTNSVGRFFLHIVKSILPVKEKTEVALTVASVLIGLLMVAMWGVAMVGYHLMQSTAPTTRSNPPAFSPSILKKEAEAPTWNLPPVALPANGTVTRYQSSQAIAPLTIVTRTGGGHYFVKLRTVGSGALIAAVFVREGQRASIEVPLGTHELTYATGRTWYGPRAGARFGPETR